MNRRAWQHTRLAQIERTKHKCEHCLPNKALAARFDVVRNGRGYLVLCRACRVSHQAPMIQAKAAATRLARARQLRLFTKGSRR